jgi:hypothetical protein
MANRDDQPLRGLEPDHYRRSGLKDAVSHYLLPAGPLTSTAPQAFPNNLTMAVCARRADLASSRRANSTIDKKPTPTRDRHLVSGTDRPAQWPADARVLRCRGLRLWHDGSAHRGVHGDTSRAIVSLLPSHPVMVGEISSDGPPHISQKWSGSG